MRSKKIEKALDDLVKLALKKADRSEANKTLKAVISLEYWAFGESRKIII